MDEQEVRYVDLREEEAHARNFAERHGGHTQHWCNGNAIRCSCGEAVGRFMLADGAVVPEQCRVCNEEVQMDEPLSVRKMAARIPISTEEAMDLGLIEDTRPPTPPPTWRQRARSKVRGTIRDLRWRLAAKIGGASREGIEEVSWLW